MNRKPVFLIAALLLAGAAGTGHAQSKSAPQEVGPLRSEIYSPPPAPAAVPPAKIFYPRAGGTKTGYALVESPTLPCAPAYYPREGPSWCGRAPTATEVISVP